MKKFNIFLFFLLLVSFSLATTVYLRKGGSLEGEVISKDNEKFILKTVDGEEKTIEWRSVKNKTIKEIHPELYKELKAKALARKKEKKKIQKKKVEKVVPIKLYVTTLKGKGRFEEIKKKTKKEKRNWKHTDFFKKELTRKIKINISGLNPNTNYVLKAVYTQYFENYHKKGGRFFKETPPERDVCKTFNLSGTNFYNIKIITAPYFQYKDETTDPKYRFSGGGGSKREYGAKSDGFDISIWLNNTLIYEKKKGKIEKYFNKVVKYY